MSKKIINFSLMILILTISLGVVSAEDNSTEIIELEEIDENVEILSDLNETSNTDVEKKDPDFDILFYSTFIENCWTRPDGPALMVEPTFKNMSGNFSIFIDDKLIDSGDVEKYTHPTLEVPGPFYNLGDHIIRVEYSGDDTYKPLTKNQTFSVKEINIELGNNEYVLENSETYVQIVPEATGTITVYINNEKKKTIKVTPLDEEEINVGYSNNIALNLDKYLTLGKIYNITVTFNGKNNGKTLKATESRILTVTYPIEVFSYSEYEYGYENIIEIYTPKNLDKNNLKAFIDNEEVKLFKDTTQDDDFEQSTYYVNITSYKPGKHIIEINYEGDEKYPAKSVNDTFDITAEIKISDYNMPYNSTIEITLTLPEDATGNLTVYIGKNYTHYELHDSEALDNGFAKIIIHGTHIGQYYLYITYDGNYEIQNISDYTIDVQPIITYPESMIWGEDKYITIQTDKEANGTLYFYRLWKLYKQVDVINGSAKISLADLPIKQYYEGETIIYYNNSNYEFELWEYWLAVKPKFALTGPASIYYADSASYSLKVFGANGKVLASKFVTIKIGSKSFKVKTNSKGIATFKVPNTIVTGKYTVKAIYNSFSTSKKLTVKQVLTLKSVKVKKSAKKLVLQATLKNKNPIKNKQVTFKFNGKTYKAKTNSKGIAKVTVKANILKKLKVGKKITYQATYRKDTVKKTIKVQK